MFAVNVEAITALFVEMHDSKKPKGSSDLIKN